MEKSEGGFLTSGTLGRIIDRKAIEMQQTDSDILIRCRRGDRAAFRSLVEAHQRMVFSLSLKMVCDEEEAKDIVQETFIRVWQSIGEYDPERPFATWLYTIATRLCLDRLKGMKRIVPLPDDESVLRQFAANADSQRKLENSEWVAIVRRLTEGLSQKQRLVFTLCQLEGLSSQEVTQITGLDASQVKSNLYVARQTIRKQLKALGYGQD